MNPNGQNPNDLNNSPYNQPPQIYTPQSAAPSYPVSAGAPGQTPPKNNKKLIIAVVILAVITVIAAALAVILNIRKLPNSNDAENALARAYDSPVGMAAIMQSAEVKSGEFKLRASYVGGKNFELEGPFLVEDGKVYFGAVSDVDRVNGFMKQVYDRQPDPKGAFDPSRQGVSNYFSYDFASFAGYHYLYYRQGGQPGGFIPEIEAAKAAASQDSRFTLTTTCDAALSDVKKLTNMNSANLSFDSSSAGINRHKYTISFATLQSIDKSVRAFFDGCYDLSQTSNAGLKVFVDKIREDYTKSPEFILGQENGKDFIEVNMNNSNAPFGGNLRFELTSTSTTRKSRVGSAGSYLERRNQFGLAYSLCRVDPVITRSEKDGYRYWSEDSGYTFPNEADTGYYCRTLDVPPQYSPSSKITLSSTTGGAVTIPAASLESLRGTHDLTFEIEKYNKDNKRYPSAIEFRDMANSIMGSLTEVTQARFADRSLIYTALPSGCAGTCNDYALSYTVAPNVQIRRSTYLPQPNTH